MSGMNVRQTRGDVTASTAVHQIVALLPRMYTSSQCTCAIARSSTMLLKQIEIRTELVSCVFESDSNGTEMLIVWIPVDHHLYAFSICMWLRGRSRGVWHRPSELSPNATQNALEQGFLPSKFVCQTPFEVEEQKRYGIETRDSTCQFRGEVRVLLILLH